MYYQVDAERPIDLKLEVKVQLKLDDMFSMLGALEYASTLTFCFSHKVDSRHVCNIKILGIFLALQKKYDNF